MGPSEAPPTAVIGLAFRFPGDVTTPSKLWECLMAGRNTWTPVPSDRFNESAFYHPDPDFLAAENQHGGHFLTQNLAAFDSQFFGISPVEARAIDPQQRLLLEVSYEAFENAGIPLSSLSGSRTSVFVAKMTEDYSDIMGKDVENTPKHRVTGVGDAILANRISYLFNLKGPSITIDTGCSGSLVALHLACQSLKDGSSDMALVGGVNLIMNPDYSIGLSNLRMMNEEGKSFPYDARGGGYGRGEGIAALVLKRVHHANSPRTPIWAIVRDTLVNQDGRTKGITHPDQSSQETLLRDVFQNAGLDPKDLDYCEGHGTGTVAGDFTEIKAIKQVFARSRPHKLTVGSIKGNIGHLEACSGLAGIIKALLMLERGMIPPNANFRTQKAGLEIAEWNLNIPTEAEPLPSFPSSIISVNSFGYGGTNAHAIIEPGLPKARRDTYGPNNHIHSDISESTQDQIDLEAPKDHLPRLFVISAASEPSLIEMAQNLLGWLAEPAQLHIELTNLAYTLSCRRSMLAWRSWFIAHDIGSVVSGLNETNNIMRHASSSTNLLFLFSGQGAQWLGMGRELLQSSRGFARSLITSAKTLQDIGWLWDLVHELGEGSPESESQIDNCEFAQPASIAVQIALVDCLEELGIIPNAVIGHSSGEIAAAYAAGYITHKAALQLAYYRGKASATTSRGLMLMVILNELEILAYLEGNQCEDVDVACLNSPTSTILSGTEKAILSLRTKLVQDKITTKLLAVDTPYHSRHMLRASEIYKSFMDDCHIGLRSEKPLRMISTVTGKVKRDGFNATYWKENMTAQVRFHEAITHYLELVDRNDRKDSPVSVLFLDIGAHPTLLRPVKEIAEAKYPTRNFLRLPTLEKNKNSLNAILNCVGRLFEFGLNPNFEKLSHELAPNSPKYLRDLPSYPWDHRQTFWHETYHSKNYRFRANPYHDLLGSRLANCVTQEPRWRYILSLDKLPWLKGHMVNDSVVFPGSGYLCMAIEAALQIASTKDLMIILEEFVFSKALLVPPSPEEIEVQASLSTAPGSESGPHRFRVFSLGEGNAWVENCYGLVSFGPENQKTVSEWTKDDEDLKVLTDDHLINQNVDSTYRKLASIGNQYGGCFRNIVKFRVAGSHGLSSIQIPDVHRLMPASHLQPHIIHPTTLDTLLHTSLPLFAQEASCGFMMPISMKKLIISSSTERRPGYSLQAVTNVKVSKPNTASARISVAHSEDQLSSKPTLVIIDLQLQGFGRSDNALGSHLQQREICFDLSWEAFNDTTSIVSGERKDNKAMIFSIDLVLSERAADSLYSLTEGLVKSCKNRGLTVIRQTWETYVVNYGRPVIVIEDRLDPFLADADDRAFSTVKSLLEQTTRTLWITTQASGGRIQRHGKGLINGLARTARNEISKSKFSVLDIQDSLDVCISDVCEQVVKMFTLFTDTRQGPSDLQQCEFAYQNGRLKIPKLSVSSRMNEWVWSSIISKDRAKLNRAESREGGVFVIAGGFGDLGETILTALGQKHASQIIILGRTPNPVKLGYYQRLCSEWEGIPLVRSFECDVSIASQIEEVKRKMQDLQLWPVRGVIQGATVLKDRSLNHMMHDEFKIPLAAKVSGTVNLSNVFRTPYLKHFIILSSLAGVVGTPGSANYAAASTFQDSFAIDQRDYSCHFMSINLSWCETILKKPVEKNLLEHGFLRVEQSELIAVLDYILSGQAQKDGIQQAVIGLDGRAVARKRNSKIFGSTLYEAVQSHFRDEIEEKLASTELKKGKDSNNVNGTCKDDSSDILENCRKKLSELTFLKPEQIKSNQHLSEYGVDSLISIEYSMWIMSEFGVSVQASEISDVNGLGELSNIVIERSKASKKTPETPLDQDRPASKSAENGRSKGSGQMPPLPIPDLGNTMRSLLNSRQPHAPPEQQDKTTLVVKDFMKDDGDGPRLQERLLSLAADSDTSDWHSEFYKREIYLRRRDPLFPNLLFTGAHILTQDRHSQAERAAIISQVAFEFKWRMEKDELLQDEINGVPLCMRSLPYLFHTTRVPYQAIDQIVKAPPEDYLIVLRRGHIFRISINDRIQDVSHPVLKSYFEWILANSHQHLTPVAAITAAPRNEWAKLRLELMASSTSNMRSLQTIEAAAFVVCLDDESPLDANERHNQFLLGEPSNRWSDRTMQFIVCQNGVSGFSGEHAVLDGANIVQLTRCMADGIRNHVPSDLPNHSESHQTSFSVPSQHIEELQFTLSDEARNCMELTQRSCKSYQRTEYAHFNLANYGKNLLRRHTCPLRAGFQVLIQLANAIFHGTAAPPESWETVSTAHFRNGRVDWLPSVSPAMAQFCTTALGQATPSAGLKNMFFKAAADYADASTKIARGRGFVAHLYALLGAAKDENRPLPALFEDPAWEATSIPSLKLLKTDSLDALELQELAFFLPDPRCIFLHYDMEDESCRFMIQAWPGRVSSFCTALEESARIIIALLQESA